MRRVRASRLVLAAGLAAVIAGTLAAPTAMAAAPPGGDITPALRTIAAGMRLTSKSTDVKLVALPNLHPASPVMISVRFGTSPWRDEAYSETTGNTFRFAFPHGGDGATRREDVTIRLQDRTTGSVYLLPLKVDVNPVFDVSIGELKWREDPRNGGCDVVGEPEPSFEVRDARGTLSYFSPRARNGAAVVRQLATRLNEVSAAGGLLRPTATFDEQDPGIFGGFDSGADLPAPQPLFPVTPGRIEWFVVEPQGDCTGIFSYSLFLTARSYPNF